nr:hypothetical protein [uncultured Mucilaginibacter sp.]
MTVTLLLAVPVTAFCQKANPQGIDTIGFQSKLSARLSSFVAEKAYLHFNKPYYFAGDTIFFKAYVVMGDKHQLSTLSAVLHVDLINAANKIEASIKLHIINGVCWGEFGLPAAMLSGNYRVRAYTQWMRNNNNDVFFEHAFPVFGWKKAGSDTLAKQTAINKTDLSFYPEGGTLVNGIKSKVAFKATAISGLGIAVNGILADQDGNHVATITSRHLGMGYFYFTPLPGKSYKATVTDANGQQLTAELPAAEPAGIALSVNNDSLAKASVKIEANPVFYNENHDKDYTLVVYSGGKATFIPSKLDNPVITMDVLKRRLKTGIALFTLFAANGEPLCERLIFVQNYDQIDLKVIPEAAAGQDGRMKIGLKALTRAGGPSAGHFSLSIVNDKFSAIDENNEHTILTNLLLTSALKGYVEQPNYYFKNPGDTSARNLDLVMLTNGYRKFEWRQGQRDTTAITFQPERGLAIGGNIKDINDKPISRGVVTLLSPGNSLLSQTADEKGDFRFSNLIYNDTAKFILQAVNAKGKNTTKITFNDKDGQPTVFTTDTPGPLGNATMQGLPDSVAKYSPGFDKGMIKGRLLEQVTIKSKKTTPIKIDPIYGYVDQTITSEQIGENGNLIFILMNKANKLAFDNVGPGNRIVPRVRTPTLLVPTKIIVNNTEMDEYFDVNSIRPDQVESVDIITTPTAPAIVFHVNYGGNPKYITTKGILPITVAGFYKAGEFYAPKYVYAGDNSAVETRTCIYWNPEIVTDKNGDASIEFYKGKGNYKIIVEGIDADGNIGRAVYRY